MQCRGGVVSRRGTAGSRPSAGPQDRVRRRGRGGEPGHEVWLFGPAADRSGQSQMKSPTCRCH